MLISQHYYLDISYESSFINTASSKGDDDRKVKNQNVMLSLGYNF
ncbi:MAG: hypothetical protein SPI57_02990 [Prevotella sp.]|nr:hypothetical protein [Prevotella sp.]